MTADDQVQQIQARVLALPGLILVLEPTLEAADRQAVIDTLLLAALAATKEGGGDGTWRTNLVQVLAKVGWSAEAFQSIRYAAPSASLTLGRAVVTAAEQVVGGTDVAPVVAAIERAAGLARAADMLALGGDDPGASAVTLALAREQGGAIRLRLIAVRSDLRRASARLDRPLELEATVQSTDIQVSAALLLLQRPVYQAVAAAVHEKVSKARANELLPLIEPEPADQP